MTGMLRGQQPLPAHSKHTNLPYTHAPGHAHPLHFLSHHDPRMLPPGMASLPVPTMQLMMSHHDVIMKQYNKAVAERLARIVEDRASAGKFTIYFSIHSIRWHQTQLGSMTIQV